jgi:uncharacterized membrane protein
MRLLFILTFVANVVLVLATLPFLPEMVASHFGAGGMADGWMPRQVNAAIMVGVQVVLFAAIHFTPRLLARTPPSLISLPNREFWLAPQNRQRMTFLVGEFMCEYGAIMFVFLFLVELLAVRANLSANGQLDERVLWCALVILLVYSIVWTVRFFRAFRIPGRPDCS